jgi:hypothetical protein
MFVFVFTISHWPGLTDAKGLLLGLYKIDPVDDIFHLLSGLYGGIAAWRSAKWSKVYLLVMAFIYGVDVLLGLFFSRQFLNPTFLTQGFGRPDFSLTNWYVNLPHIAITVIALWVVYGLASSKQDAEQS